MDKLSSIEAFNTAIDIAAAIIMATLIFFIAVRGKESRKQMSVYLIMVIDAFLVCAVTDAFTWYLLPYSSDSVIFEICLMIDYVSFQFVVAAMHWYIIESVRDRVNFPGWMRYSSLVLCSVLSVLWIASKWNGLFYTITDAGYLHTPHFIWSQIPGVLIAGADLIVIMYHWKKLEWKERMVYLCYAVISTGTDIFGVFYNMSVVYLGFAIIILIMYVQLDVEKEKVISRQRAELMEAKTNLMVSQIKPHFIYNTLSTISELCRKDPLLAQETTNHFSSYLRVNLHSMENKELVPFSKELEHVKTYLWIEQLRFGEDLEVSYHIETDQFLLPQLTVQPLVENCVKHGMMGCEGVCHIDLTAKELDDCYKIVISDDGCGFDTEKINRDDKKHVGLRSVEQRLELMIHGSIQIKSKPSEGTEIIIEIPKEW